MFANYIKVALRNLAKQKVYFFLNLLGLATGLALFLLSAFELDAIYHFDIFHKDADRIYGIVQVYQQGNQNEQHINGSPGALKQAMLNEFQEIEEATQFFSPGQVIFKYGEKVIYENRVLYCDAQFLSVFNFPLLTGNPQTALAEPNSIILTPDAAMKYFGEKNPVGQTIILDKTKNMKVTGVLQKIPNNSSIQFDFLVSLNSLPASYLSSWEGDDLSLFIRLKHGASANELEQKFSEFIKIRYPEKPAPLKYIYPYPLPGFHLKGQHITTYLRTDIPFFYILGFTIVILFLLVVCFNFTGLSVARNIHRGKEVVMRKVVGANRSQLINQFLGESLLLAILAYPVAIIIFQLIKEPFYAIFSNSYDLSLLARPQPLLYAFGATVAAGIVAGLYPAFYLSAHQPVSVLKGEHFMKKGKITFRKVLIVLQFSISILLIIFVLATNKQSYFLLNIDMGYHKEGIITIPVAGEMKTGIESLKRELKRCTDIEYVSTAGLLPLFWENEIEVIPQGKSKDETILLHGYGVDYDFIEAFGIKMVHGRTFDQNYNDRYNYIINQEAASQLMWDNPVGKELVVNNRRGVVVGVTKNFQFRSLNKSVAPAVLYLAPEHARYIFAKAAPDVNTSEVIEHIKTLWRKTTPGLPFQSFLLEHRFNDSFDMAWKFTYIVGSIGIMAIIVSCIGLFALASYTISRRTKEIGLRKVLGATVTSLTRMLMSNFLLLVAIANIITWPFAYLIIKLYFESNFYYHINMPFDFFIITGILTLLVSFFAIIFNTFKAAQSNPVEALKYE